MGRLTAEQFALARRLRARGVGLLEICRQVGCSYDYLRVVILPAAVPVSSPELGWSPGPGRLSLADREEIVVGLARGETFTAIAARVAKAVSTVCREVAANGGRAGYRAWAAHLRAWRAARRPKTRKLDRAGLANRVAGWLERFWSPEEIARRLRIEFPDDPMMWVSHETIYKTLFVQGRGELRRELARCLRSGRTARRPRTPAGPPAQIPGMVMISERPAEVADRAVPGHWEGDLILGRNNRSQVGTLVERSTRFVLLLHLPADRRAATVAAAIAAAIQKLPRQLVRSVTWDQGKEMAAHRQFTVDTGVQIYFCDPHSPWQRGSNENTNGLLRQYLPKSTDLSVHTQADLDAIADSLNDRPRETLGFMKPSEKLAELLATTG